MRKFQKGDVVLCKKFEVAQKLCIHPDGMSFEPYIDDTYFNRKAYISNISEQDKDKYEITFLDDGTAFAWVNGDDLILLLR